MTKSGYYQNCLPQLPSRATGMALVKNTGLYQNTGHFKFPTPSPLKRMAQLPATDTHARNPKRLRLLQDGDKFNCTGAMYSIYTPGPQYLRSELTNTPYPYHRRAVSGTPNGQGNNVFCCLKLCNPSFAPTHGKENACLCCNPERKRKFKNQKRKSPVKKKKRTNKDSKASQRTPFSYGNFLHSLERDKKLARNSSPAVSVPLKTGYNNGFMPLMTSTPHQTTPKPVFFESRSKEISIKSTVLSQETKETENNIDVNTTAEIVKELAKDFDGSFGNLSNNAIADILDKLPDVKNDLLKKGGKVAPGKILLPSKSDSDKSSPGSNDGNNNKKRSRQKLPGMYPLGAPQAASSPIHPSIKKRDVAFDETTYASSKVEQNGVLIRPLANVNKRSSVQSVVWRPW